MPKHLDDTQPSIELDNYPPSESQMKQAQALIKLLKRCDQEALSVCVFGGYGLDALYGQLTRDHGDFDLLIKSEDKLRFDQILDQLGYQFAPGLSETGRKEAYTHPILEPAFKLEVAILDETQVANLSQQFDFEAEIALFFPEQPNGRLLGYPLRAPTTAGVQVINKIQALTGIERGWGEFSHKQHQATLIQALQAKRC